MKMPAFGLLIGAALAVYGCGRTPNFKFEEPPSNEVSFSRSHAVKELTGSAADILWVIDNSGSMDSYQQQVIVNTSQFIGSFLNLAKGNDWRMGLISTDEREQPYIGFMPNDRLDFTHPDPVRAFQFAVGRLGTNGSATEKAFDPVVRAFSAFPDFNRPKAKLFLILVSDELEQSRQSTFQFIDYLVQLKGSLDNLVTYGIFEMPDQNCGSETYVGGKYEHFMKATNGLAFPICLPNYGDLLSQIGADIGERLVRPRIDLDKRPKDGTLKVYYKGSLLPSGPKELGGVWYYDYEQNAVIFHDLSFAASDNESVQVVYSIEGT